MTFIFAGCRPNWTTDTVQVTAEIHQRLAEEEKEQPQQDPKEKSPQSGANKKAKKEKEPAKKEKEPAKKDKEPPKKKTAEKKGKGIHGTRTWSLGHFKPLLTKRKQTINQAC